MEAIIIKDILLHLKGNRNKINPYLLIIMCFLCLGLFSCTDNINDFPKNPMIETDCISLLIPSKSFNYTRNESENEYDISKEGEIKNLYIAVVKLEESSENVETVRIVSLDINTNDLIERDGKIYSKYNLDIKDGKYRFYILANIDKYSKRVVSDIKDEEDIKNLSLEFSEDTILTPDELPMVCLPDGISLDNNIKDQNTTYSEIDKRTNPDINLYAELKYLCAKIR